MPYSKQQLKWANATKQPFAKRWNKEAKGKKLPTKVKKEK